MFLFFRDEYLLIVKLGFELQWVNRNVLLFIELRLEIIVRRFVFEKISYFLLVFVLIKQVRVIVKLFDKNLIAQLQSIGKAS